MAKKINQKRDVGLASNKSSFVLDLDTVPEPQYAAGSARSYLVTSIPEKITKSRGVSSKDLLLIAALVLLSALLRLRGLEKPNSVVFDEVHFGGFSQKYILGTFFMDVHPPLAKMLFAWVALIGGFKGDFDFASIGDIYPETVPYVLMRFFPAALGVLTVLLCYLTLRSSGVRPAVAFATASCLNLDNSYITISRYILLDSPLMFFIAASIYAFKKFEVQQPFSLEWFRSLLSCAIALGLALSSKWVGLFTLIWIGLSCAGHMWFLIGDLRVSPCAIVKHAAARATMLLGIPAVIYLFCFSLHFQVLPNEGPGSAFMTSAFRAGLRGSPVPKSTTAQVGYGSIVSIRHLNTQGGYLHSHNHLYPAGSKQQQITLYPHIDVNNEWLIEPYNMSIPDEFTPITDGTKIRLKHIMTHKRLHSHDEKPPVSERDWQKEVSCYGYEGFGGDANDDWVVEIVKHKSEKGEAQENVKALGTVFRLRHAMSGNYLFSSEVKLPSWGFEQQEVTAAGQGARPLTHWYIETNDNDRLKEEEKDIVSYPTLTFWQKFVESHKTMWKINQGLTSFHKWQSDPQDWPLLLRGINYWAKDHTQVYFLGNPVVWWTASACLVAFVIHVGISVLKWQAGQTVAQNKNVFNFNAQMLSYFLGWAIHYAPFFIMGRQLFLHHYLPAYYFAILGLGHVFDLLVSYSKKLSRPAYGAIVLFVTLALAMYYTLSPLIDGSQWTKSQCLSSKLLSSWDYDCNTFFESKEEYLSYTPEAAKPEATSSVNVINEASPVPVDEQPLKADMSGDEEMEAPPAAETHYGDLPEYLQEAEEETEAENAADVGSGADVENDVEVEIEGDSVEYVSAIDESEPAEAEDAVVEEASVEAAEEPLPPAEPEVKKAIAE